MSNSCHGTSLVPFCNHALFLHTNLYRLKKLKEEKVKLDIEMDSLKTQMENKERAICKLEEDLCAA